MNVPFTHDYTRQCWGHATILRTDDHGQTLTGHMFGCVNDGDYVILKNGERTTRYQIATSRWISSTDDMYEVALKFAPRS